MSDKPTENTDDIVMVKCYYCDESFDEEDMRTIPDGNQSCDSCYNEKFVCCEFCEEDIEIDDSRDFDGQILCESCYDERIVCCRNCSTELDKEDDETQYSEHYDAYMCESCFRDTHFNCDDCGDIYHNDEMMSNDNGCYCEDCYERNCEDCFFRPSQRGFQLTNDTKKLDTLGFTIGIELETHNDGGISADRFSSEFRKYIEAKGDGSLNDNGVEFISLPSNNDKAYDIIHMLCKELNEHGFTTNNRCGYHLHIGTEKKSQFTLDMRHKIMILYAVHKDNLFAMIPSHRWSNHFCNGGERITPRLFEKIDDRIKESYHQRRERYQYLNTTAFEPHGTLEIRCHQGTINFDEVMNWIKINLNMFKFAVTNSYETLLKMRGTNAEFKSLFIGNDYKLRRYYNQKVRLYQYPNVPKNNPMLARRIMKMLSGEYKPNLYTGYQARNAAGKLYVVYEPEFVDDMKKFISKRIESLFKKRINDTIQQAAIEHAEIKIKTSKIEEKVNGV